jgi:hypothetical protein
MQQKQGLAAYIGSPDHRIAQLTARVEKLEEAVFKKRKRKAATEAQRFLLFASAGGMEIIHAMPISQNMKDLFVSRMLDIDQDNVRKFRSEVGKKHKPLLETEANYVYLTETFMETKDKKREAEASNILRNILNEKEKQSKKL